MRRRNFFADGEYERLNKPHPTAHDDPWNHDKEGRFEHVFWLRNPLRKALGFLPIPGMGSYYPHLFLAFAAEYFFRSWLIVILGIFAWTIVVELPVFLVLQYTSLLPSDRSLWDTIPVFYRENPTPADIQEAKNEGLKYENPAGGIFYAVCGLRRNYLRATFQNPRLYRGSKERNPDSPYKEVHGFVYKKKDISSYILYSIFVDVLVGVGGALLAYYLHRSFDLQAFRGSADGILVLEYLGLFFLVAHLISYWGWLFTIVAFGYIFILGAANMREDVFSWTPYLVFFGSTLYFWIVFFRNPFRWLYFLRYAQSDMGAENRVGEGVSVASTKGVEVLARDASGEGGDKAVSISYTEQPDVPTLIDTNGDGKANVVAPPHQVLEDVSARFSDHSAWWLFAATNYDSMGYNAWFGSMVFLIVVAIVAIAT